MRGFPYDVDEQCVLEFYGLRKNQVPEMHFILDGNGRPSGEVYSVFGDLNTAKRVTNTKKFLEGRSKKPRQIIAEPSSFLQQGFRNFFIKNH